MLQTDSLDSAIHHVLARVGTCTLEALAERLPSYSSSQMFAAVDRLSRGGTVTLQRQDSSDYSLSLAPRPVAKARHMTQS